jgi:TonB family protein
MNPSCPPWHRVLLAAALLALTERAAVADEPPSPDAPPPSPSPPPERVEPPRPLTSLTVEAPAGALGAHTVVLELTVNADGTVREARALVGDEPFASRAVETARGWRFSPATRLNKPVAARIRVRVDFNAKVPEPVNTGTPPQLPTGAPVMPSPPGGPKKPPSSIPPAKPPEPEGIVVDVHGERPAPAASSLSRSEVRVLPGAFGDPFRAIEALPGVTPLFSGIPFFYVRGAPPGNVGYFLDGIRVPLIYHLALGPSVIHPAVMERVDLHPGGYPARFGRFAGGIVSGETKAPALEPHGEGNIRLFDAGAMVEAPLPFGRGSALLAGRYSYTAALLSVASPTTTLDYWDYQGRLSYDISPTDRLTAFFFGSYDYLGEDLGEGTQTLFSTQFHRVDLRYDSEIGASTKIRHALTAGVDVTAVDEGRFTRDRMLAARVEVTHRANSFVTLRTGLNATLDYFDIDFTGTAGSFQRGGGGRFGGDDGDGPFGGPDDDDDGGPFGDDDEGNDPGIEQIEDLFPERRDLAIGLHADAVIEATPNFEITPGARVDFWSLGGLTTFSADARLATRTSLGDDIRVIQALGFVHQGPAFVIPAPGVQVGNLEGGLQQSLQTSAGVEVDLPAETTGSATVFWNGFFNMNDLLGTAGAEGSDTEDFNLDSRTNGSAVGLEIYIRRRLTKQLGGFLAYTLSRSSRTFGRTTTPSRFDRRHVINAALGWDLGRGWRAGTRLVFYTGLPADLVSSASASTTASRPDRLPPFFRMDVRVEKRWKLGDRAWISLVLEALNAMLAKETVAVQCGLTDCQSVRIGPVALPSIGVEAGF